MGSESGNLLSAAEELLAANDLIGSRHFAERALESDPLTPSDRADRIIAIADVILASGSRPDPYDILNCRPGSAPSSFISSYRRLSCLLKPDSNPLPHANYALELVREAYASLLSSGFLREPDNVTGHAFWTLCPACCHVYLYERAYLGANLKCRKCKKAFVADELLNDPPVVAGTDMYYCNWGYFPVGPTGSGKQAHAVQKVVPAAAEGRVKRRRIDINLSLSLDSSEESDDADDVSMD